MPERGKSLGVAGIDSLMKRMLRMGVVGVRVDHTDDCVRRRDEIEVDGTSRVEKLVLQQDFFRSALLLEPPWGRGTLKKAILLNRREQEGMVKEHCEWEEVEGK